MRELLSICRTPFTISTAILLAALGMQQVTLGLTDFWRCVVMGAVLATLAGVLWWQVPEIRAVVRNYRGARA
jgi:hypothetical protein